MRRVSFSLACALLGCKALDGSSPAPSSSSSAPAPSASPAPPTDIDVLGTSPLDRRPVMRKTKRGEILVTKNWPEACELLTQADIESIFPGASEINESRGVVGTRSIEEFAARAPNFNDESKYGAICRYIFKLPSQAQPQTLVWIRLRTVADPELVESYFNRNTYVEGDNIQQTDKCRDTKLDAVVCRAGPLIFEVGGYGPARFKGTAGVASRVFWAEKVLPELAKSVAARVDQP